MNAVKLVELFLHSASDWCITDRAGNTWSVEDAAKAWKEGRVENFNMAFKRLVDRGFDLKATKEFFGK